jgi:hypothetical protein
MDITQIQTPKADAVLKMFTFVTKEGIVFNDSATHSQKVIIEIILNRGINNESMDWINRIHLMAYTRHGKSLAIAVGVSVRDLRKKKLLFLMFPRECREVPESLQLRIPDIYTGIQFPQVKELLWK